MAWTGDERYFRELAEHSNAVLWMFTADWRELLFTTAYERSTGEGVARAAP